LIRIPLSSDQLWIQMTAGTMKSCRRRLFCKRGASGRRPAQTATRVDFVSRIVDLCEHARLKALGDNHTSW
jgi:hypothetical protein